MSTTGAQIGVGAREIRFNIHANEEKFAFRPRKEQCSMIHIKYGPNPQGLKEVHIQPQLVDNMVKKNKEIKKKPEQKKVKQMTKKRHQKPFPHHQRRTNRCGNEKKKPRSPPPHHQEQTRWCGGRRKSNPLHPLLRDRAPHQARTEWGRVLLIGP